VGPHHYRIIVSGSLGEFACSAARLKRRAAAGEALLPLTYSHYGAGSARLAG